MKEYGEFALLMTAIALASSAPERGKPAPWPLIVAWCLGGACGMLFVQLIQK